MDFMTAIDIGASGLKAERTLLNVISMNLANVNTTETAEGGPYRRKMVDFETAPTQSPFDQAMQSALDREMQGVKVSGIVNDPRPLRKVYEPGHPNADQDGYVSYPNVNVVQEMANMMTATRSYEANVTSISTAKAMFDKALELSR